MTISYGRESRAAIATLDGRLQRLLHRYADVAPPELDLKVLEGHRGEAAQHAAFVSGASKLDWPESKHNSQPARAFDFVPYPFSPPGDWRDLARFARIVGALQLVAAQERIRIRSGLDWDRDGRTADETFVDAGHVELDEP